MSNASTEKHNIGRDTNSRILLEENEKLREMLEKLIASGKEQQDVISSLSGKVEDLERKLSRRKTLKPRRPRVTTFRSVCNKPLSSSLQGRQMGLTSKLHLQTVFYEMV
ncbi:Large proline-rich protein bag6 [Ancistrocladus abbreviatus]